MKRFVAACAQFAVEPMAVRENLSRCEAWIERAVKEHEAELVVLPETVTTGFTPGCPAEELWDAVDILPGAHSAFISDIARKLRVMVAFPTYERGEARGVVYNSVALLGADGAYLGVYRKTHLFPTERKAAGGWSTPGNRAVVIETPLGNVGLSICYDGDFPELYRVMALRGAEVVVRPSALLRSFEIWEMVNRARAYDNHIYMVSCNAIGPDAGKSYYFGHSMIVSPIAQVLAQARGTEEIVSASLDPDPIRYVTYGSRSPMIFDHLEDRNVAAYEGIEATGRSRFEPMRRIPMKA